MGLHIMLKEEALAPKPHFMLIGEAQNQKPEIAGMRRGRGRGGQNLSQYGHAHVWRVLDLRLDLKRHYK